MDGTGDGGRGVHQDSAEVRATTPGKGLYPMAKARGPKETEALPHGHERGP